MAGVCTLGRAGVERGYRMGFKVLGEMRDKATGFSDWGWVATRGLSVELMGPCARPVGRGRTWPRIGHRWPWRAATYMSISTAI